MTNDIMTRMQARTKHAEHQIHVQVLGEINVNREYGYASELRAPTEVIQWLNAQEPTFKSGASEGVYYVQMDAVRFPDNTNALLIHGEALNHEKGCVLGVDPSSPTITQLFDYASQADSVLDMDKSEVMQDPSDNKTELDTDTVDTLVGLGIMEEE